MLWPAVGADHWPGDPDCGVLPQTLDVEAGMWRQYVLGAIRTSTVTWPIQRGESLSNLEGSCMCAASRPPRQTAHPTREYQVPPCAGPAAPAQI